MSRTLRAPTPHSVDWSTVQHTALRHDGVVYRLHRDPDGLIVSGADFREVVGAYASGSDAGLTIKLSPGSQTYFEARAFHGQPATEADLVGAVIVAAIGGHPDADEDRADTKLNVVWGHHLAIVLGEDPRRIAETYAPTETKTISRRIQDLDVSGVEVVRLGDGDPFGPGRAVSPRPA